MTGTETQTTSPEPRAPAPGGAAEPPRAGENLLARAWSRTRTYTREFPMVVGFIALGLIARILFWAFTDRRLDDAMITIKFDKNLADGFGLVHNLGEGHVQGFTSALSVLVPLPGELIYHGGGFLMIRLVSLGCFVLAALYANRIAQELKVGRWPLAFALAYLALDQNQVFFGVAGMETQIAVAVLFAGIYYVLVEDYPKSGVALGLAVLARPDFVLWVAPAYLFLLIRNWRLALRAGVLSAALVVPWLIFTTIYYRSPVPNTIPAKNLSFVPEFPGYSHVGDWVSFLGDHISANAHSWTLFGPFYEAIFVTHAPLSYGAARAIAVGVAALAVVGAVSTLRRWSWLPAIAYLGLFAAYKVVYLTVGYFEWYGTPAAALLIFMAAVGLDRVSKWVSGAIGGRFSPGEVVMVPAVLLALVYAMALPYRTIAEARVQNDIEDKVRAQVGRYLGQVVKPGQTITSESSGYVGYDTNGAMYDYPGLESPKVLDAIRAAEANHAPGFPDSLMGIVALLHADWLVLRPWEVDALAAWYPDVAKQYKPVRRFSVPGGRSPIKVGDFWVLNIDRSFIVLRRKAGAAPPTP
jgi:hypothetical protein